MNLSFGPPKTIQTKAGPMVCRICSNLTPEFWAGYKVHREQLSLQGFTLKNNNGRFELHHISVPKEPSKPVKIAPYTLHSSKGLLPYQKAPVAHLCASLLASRKALDASEMGVGKSYHAIAVARELNLMPVIICPKVVIPSWKKVCEHFKVKPGFIANWEGVKTKNFKFGSLKPDSFTGKPNFEWHISKKSRVLFIFDEAHKANGNGTGFSKILISAKDYYVLMATGTPITKLSDFRAIGSMLGMFDYDKFNTWLEQRAQIKDDINDKYISTSDAEDLAQLHKEIFPSFGVRVRKKDIPGFPDIQNLCETIEIKNPDLQDKQFNITMDKIKKLEKQKISAKQKFQKIKAFRSTVDDIQAQKLLTQIRKAQANQIVLYLRYRQLAEKLKIPSLVSYTKDLLLQNYSVAVFCNFNDSIDSLLKHFPKAGYIRGGQKPSDRQIFIDKFQKNSLKLILCNIDAGGIGISLHDTNGNFPRISLICPNPSAYKTSQVLHRIHRSGGKSKAINKLLFAAKTIEEKVCDTVQQKLKALDKLLDGDLAESETFTYTGEK